MKTIKVLKPEKDPVKRKQKEEERKRQRKEERETSVSNEPILDSPIHDTGSVWYAVLCFFLPLLGLILFPIFKVKRYYRNYKSCKKGTIIGWSVIGAIVVLFCIFLLLTLV